MNEIVNKFLFAGDKLIPEMHLRQPHSPIIDNISGADLADM